MMQRTNRVVCPYHPNSPLIEDYSAGDMICPECGLVVGDRVIDVGNEWRTFSNEDGSGTDMNRVGGPENPLLDGNDLSTTIGRTTRATALNSSRASKYPNQFTREPSRNKHLIEAFSEISKMAAKIHAPKSIVDHAQLYYKDVDGTGLPLGRTMYAKASACLYIACRQEGVPRTFKEICAVSRSSKKEIGRAFKDILKQLKTSMEHISSGDFMTRFCSRLDLPREVEKAASHIAKKASTMLIVNGRSPISVAAAAIYMASQVSQHKRSRQQIGEVAGTVQGTISESYQLMLPYATNLFPDDFVFTTPISKLPGAPRMTAEIKGTNNARLGAASSLSKEVRAATITEHS